MPPALLFLTPSLASDPVWWQSNERSSLLVIELTSFPKYQKPCWIIKMCLYWGTYFWQNKYQPNITMRRTQSCICWSGLKRSKKVYFFQSITFLWSRLFFFPPRLNCRGRVALCGDWIAGTLVISTRKPIITQTVLLPSGHTSSTLQTQWPVNVSVAGCLSSSLLYTSYSQKERSDTLKGYKVERWPTIFANLHCIIRYVDLIVLPTRRLENVATMQ